MKTILPKNPTYICLTGISTEPIVITEQKDINNLINTLKNNIQVTFSGIGNGNVDGFVYTLAIDKTYYVFHTEYLMKDFIKYGVTGNSNIDKVYNVFDEMIEKYSE